MIASLPGNAFIHKHFTPENRLAEIICALVMVLSFTATTSATFHDTKPHALLIAVLGCNIAWGIVDGVTYIMGNLLNRGVRARLVRALKQDRDDPKAMAVVTSRLESSLGPMLTAAQMEQVRSWIVESVDRSEPEPVGIQRSDIYTGIACFMVVFGATLPLLIPFLLIENDSIALRVSNGLMLAMLFAVGWRWAEYVNINRWKMGLTLLGIGFVLVAITIVLGG